MSSGRSPHAPDDSALWDALRPLVAARFGHDARITRVHRQPVLNAVERLQVHLTQPTGLRTWEMIGKFRNRLQTEKEMLLYQYVLTEVTGAPELYGAVCEDTPPRYWLFLEPLGGDYWQVDDPVQIELAFTHLARLHAHFEDAAVRALGGDPSALLSTPAPPEIGVRVLAALGRGLGHAAFPANRRAAGDALRIQVLAAAADPTFSELGAPQSRFLDRLVLRFDRVLAALDLLPPTLVHHDFHRWNVRVEPDHAQNGEVQISSQTTAARPRLRLHDWEGASLGCRQFDLYYVPNPFLPWVQGQWDGAVPAALAEFALQCYWRAHNEYARSRLSWEELREVQCYVSLFRCLIAAQLQLQGGPTGTGLPDPTRLSTLDPRHRLAARQALDDAARISRWLGI